MPSKRTNKIAPDGKPLTSVQRRVIEYIEEHGSITPKEAETYLHNHRLASTIEVLRNKRGYDIETLRMNVTNAYGEPTWYGKYVFGKGSR